MFDYVWPKNIAGWNCLKCLEILLTFVRVGDVSVHYKSIPV